MKRRWKIVMGLLVLAVIGAWLLFPRSPAVRDLENTRRSLRQEGLKIELREFDLSLSPELSRRAALLGRTTRAELTNRVRPDPMMGDMRDFPALVTFASSNAAVPTWKIENPTSYRGESLWPKLREALSASRDHLETARQAAVSGPIRFEPIGSQYPNALLPYLGDMKNLATAFGVLTVLGLHDGEADAAWTNLVAVTCLATAYNPEPIDVSQLLRFGLVAIAFDSTWNALQAPGWTEAQLAALQRRWESVELWSNLPETAAYSRASMAATCEMERRQPLGLGMSIKEMLRSPPNAWSALRVYWSQVQYRARGSYEDERALLLYYRDRELELRRAVRAATWAEMRQLPGVTNLLRFTSSNRSRVVSMMNMRQLNLSFQGRGVGLLGRAAEAETRRRLVVAALALERYRRRHDSYPTRLADLVPELLETTPVDFMDGQPLRYQLSQEGHFLLYSVGLDCVDNGGVARRPGPRGPPWDEPTGEFGFRQGTDLVWARPASAAEIEGFQEEERKAEEIRMKTAEEAQASAWWDITIRRQANVEKIFAAPPVLMTNEPVYGGRRLSEILSNRPGESEPRLFELLALKQVFSGAEPETVAFELPIRYEALTNVGELVLCIDRYGWDDDEGWAVGQYACVRATNGDCRLVWSTIYETPGKHALLAGLGLKEPGEAGDGFFGPVTPYVVTNLCQFTPASAFFDAELGVKFYGRLPESNGTYSIELKSPAGERLKTITGSTTNGFIKVHWDLTDDRGGRCTNDAYDSVFHISLPDSGRAQTLKGP